MSSFAWWLFVPLFILLGGGGFWVVWRARRWLSRMFLFPLRSIWWSAFLLGALPMLLVVALIGTTVVAPVGAQRASDRREQKSLVLVAEAREAVRDGDEARAHDLLARAPDKGVTGWADVRDDADELREQQQVEAERASDGCTDEARVALDRGDYEEAALEFESLGSYRDSVALAVRARRLDARRILGIRRRAFRNGDFLEAQQRAVESIATYPLPEARALRRAATTRIEQARAERKTRARERARRQAEARAQERERLRQERERRRQEREQREAQPAPVAPPAEPSAPSTGGCESGVPYDDDGTRDGDGDGYRGE